MPTLDELERLKVLTQYDESARVSYPRIYLDEIEGVNAIEYTQNSQIKQIYLKDGKMYEIVPELIHIQEDNPNNHRLI